MLPGSFEEHAKDNKLNADLALPDDPATTALPEFLDKALEK